MKTHRPETCLIVVLVALATQSAPSTAFAQQSEQLAGIVHSVDADAKKFVVTPTEKGKNVDVTVNDQTVIETSTGKVLPLKELKAGDGVGIVHVGGLASKVLVNVKPSELTGHVKSVGATLKTFVVTETGTTTDYTVAITPETIITTTDGKKIDLKDLKKGDGVGISHINSVASKITVNVKPAG